MTTSTDALGSIKTARDSSAVSWESAVDSAQIDVDQNGADASKVTEAEQARDACLEAYDRAIEMLEVLGEGWRVAAEDSLEEARALEDEFGDDSTAQSAIDELRGCSDLIDGDFGDLVLIEVMPEHLREQHRAARNWGSYPANGAERVLMPRGVAAELDANDEYGWIVRDAKRADLDRYELRAE